MRRTSRSRSSTSAWSHGAPRAKPRMPAAGPGKHAGAHERRLSCTPSEAGRLRRLRARLADAGHGSCRGRRSSRNTDRRRSSIRATPARSRPPVSSSFRYAMAAMIDPVTLEVIRNTLPAIANEMAADLQRTSYNMMIYEVCDFCTALIGHQRPADLAECRRRLALRRRSRRHHRRRRRPLGRGWIRATSDVFITNHQRVAGQHLNNIVIYMPSFTPASSSASR